MPEPGALTIRPTQVLSDEHRVIERVLEVFQRMADKAATAGKVDRDDGRKALHFFREFADRCHHAKEERHLFRLLGLHGFSADEGPVAVMLHEHEQGRAALAEVEAALKSSPDAVAARRFTAAASLYVDLLRGHIQKEDHCLFPMADEALARPEQAELLAAFEKAEATDVGPGVHEECLGIAEDLGRRYGVAGPERPAPGPGGGHRGCSHHHKR